MQTNLSQLTDAQLDVEYAAYDGHPCDYEDDCVECRRLDRIEREQDMRDLWNFDDDRVRESVGNYR